MRIRSVDVTDEPAASRARWRRERRGGDQLKDLSLEASQLVDGSRLPGECAVGSLTLRDSFHSMRTL